jgi:hypothetical protein
MRRRLSPKQRRRLVNRLTLIVAGLHAALLLTLAVAPKSLPPDIHLWQLLWAAERRAMFYPLIGVVLIAPALSVLAWRVRGRHRYYLLSTWGASLVLIGALFADRVALMLRIIWWRFVG